MTKTKKFAQKPASKIEPAELGGFAAPRDPQRDSSSALLEKHARRKTGVAGRYGDHGRLPPAGRRPVRRAFPSTSGNTSPPSGRRLIDAEILVRSDLGPMRLRTNGRRTKPSGIYYSVKSGRHFPWESRPELHDLHRAEVRHDVVSSMVQPHTLKLFVDGSYLRYTPDRQDFLANGKTEIVEVKGDLKSLEPDYVEKLDFARSVYEGLGYSFRVTERSEIEAEPTFSAIDRIQSYRRTSITNADILMARRHLTGRDGCQLIELRNVFGPGPMSLAKICALAVRRVIKIDIEKGLSPSSMVTLVEGDK